MEQADRHVSPAQLARALGLSESTVKRWIDQGEIPADKTPGGHRRIRFSEAVRLLRSGRGTGPAPEALGFEPADGASPALLPQMLCSQTPERTIELLESLYASGLGAGEIADQWIAPAMHDVGHGWETGRLSITREHGATSVMIRALHGLLRTQPAPASDAPRAIVAGLAQDPYLLAPLCAQLVLMDAGFATTNFGPDTPVESLVSAVREQRPALVAVSFSVGEATGSRARASLGAACRESGSALIVGGRGLRPDLVDDLGATAWCRSMTELDRMARHLAARTPGQELAHAG